jgi:hypothetical protein
MDDVVYNIRQLLRALDTARLNAQTIWRDSAERDISRRYLDPLFDAANSVQLTSEQMKDVLYSAIQYIESADVSSKEALELSSQIIRLIHEIDKELEGVRNGVQAIDSGLSILEEDCRIIDSLLKQAHVIGESAPPRQPRQSGILLWPLDLLEQLVYATVDSSVKLAEHTVDISIATATKMIDNVVGNRYNDT